jgi:hypothetical protein
MSNHQRPLAEEIDYFNANKSRLLSDYGQKFVLIKGSEVIDSFLTEEDAIKEGYQRFGNDGFLVKQVLPVEPVMNFFSGQLAI